jgi:hypothetical protein
MKAASARLTWIAAAVLGTMLAAPAPATERNDMQPTTSTVVELRQYKIVHGKRDAMIDLFERALIEPQEADGMRLVGQFRDLDDPDRFVWIRTFPGMPEREKALADFYYGPVWQAHRDAANPMLEDNDNVLLLRPASPAGAFPPADEPRPPFGAPASEPGLVVATIYYLWKAPEEGFASFFESRLRPALEAAGIPVLAALVPEHAPNNFPRLPVRQGEKLFVWFTHFRDEADRAAKIQAFRQSEAWQDGVGAELDDHLERAPQVLRLEPTPRSLLR